MGDAATVCSIQKCPKIHAFEVCIQKEWVQYTAARSHGIMPRTNNCLLKFESSEINIIADKKFFTIPLFGISDNQFAHKLITGENGY